MIIQGRKEKKIEKEEKKKRKFNSICSSFPLWEIGRIRCNGILLQI
jgi:hypothetical protein